MKLSEIPFKRKFSVNFYRNLRLKLGEMSFRKDWVNDKRGDPYPLIEKTGDIRQSVGLEAYKLHADEGGTLCRMMGEFFPYATYEAELDLLRGGEVGFTVSSPLGDLSVTVSDSDRVTIRIAEQTYEYAAYFAMGDALSVTFRSGGVSVYIRHEGAYALVCDRDCDLCLAWRREDIFRRSKVSLTVALEGGGECQIGRAEWFLDGGISHADMKPIRYEDGTVMVENGRVYLTWSSRCEKNTFQTVVSWNPTLCDFRLEGALFFDVGDGLWCADVASSVIYDRTAGLWRIWMCSFSHGHILARGTSLADPRFGIHVIDVERMEPASPTDSRDSFLGFEGDEDPDLILRDGKWHLAICRLDPDARGYRYYHFVSDDPFDGFTFVDRTDGVEKTGGLFIPTHRGDVVFACGSDFKRRAVYDVYPISDFTAVEHLQADYDDGGFRGWGTVMLLPVGSRLQYVWITFDRHNASGYNWSYGNIYVFVSDTFRP